MALPPVPGNAPPPPALNPLPPGPIAPPATPIAQQSTAADGAAAQVAPMLAQIATASNGHARLEMKLHPEELGRVAVRIERSGAGQATVRVEAERPETLAALHRDLPALNAALDRAGLSGDSRVVTLALAPREAPQAAEPRPAPAAAPDQSAPSDNRTGWQTDGGGAQGQSRDAPRRRGRTAPPRTADPARPLAGIGSAPPVRLCTAINLTA
jgi:hypothetical protein